MWDFVKFFFDAYSDDHVVFLLYSVSMMNHIDWLHQTCIGYDVVGYIFLLIDLIIPC